MDCDKCPYKAIAKYFEDKQDAEYEKWKKDWERMKLEEEE